MARRILEILTQRFGDQVLETHSKLGDETAVVDRSAWHEVISFLRDEPETEMAMLVDLTAVDYPERAQRFEVVAHLLSLKWLYRLRLKTRLALREEDGVAELASVTDLFASANWAERECFDMFGIRFVGHPDLRRILLYPEFEGFPLRRDYPAGKTQPLVPYRRVDNIEKLPPFGPHEGMPFGRNTHHLPVRDDSNEGQK